jgi:hypothetical protein
MGLILDNYNNCCQTISDINEHLPTLKRYADSSNIIVELGVRFVTSTWAFLNSSAKEVYSYDINYNEHIKNAEEICKNENRFWKFTLDSSLTCDIPNCDLLFIDTFHTYHQVKAEIEKHHSKVNKYMIFHDVESFGRKSENGFELGN